MLCSVTNPVSTEEFSCHDAYFASFSDVMRGVSSVLMLHFGAGYTDLDLPGARRCPSVQSILGEEATNLLQLERRSGFPDTRNHDL